MDVGLVMDSTGVLRREAARKRQNKWWNCAAGKKKKKKDAGTIWEWFDERSNLDYARLEFKHSRCSKSK